MPPQTGGKLTRILVTDAGERSSLAVVRSLGRAGHHVDVCASLPRPLAGASRHVERAFQVPDPEEDPAGYRIAVGALVEERGIELLIPTTDASALLLLDLREIHPELVIPFPGRERYEALSDKRIVAEVGAELGIAVPEQRVLDSANVEPDALFEQLGRPLVLKPSRSVVVTQGGLSKHGVRIVTGRADLERALEAYPDTAFPILAQRRVVGPGRGVFALMWEGRLYGAFGHRRIREKPPSGGVSVYRESVRVPPHLLEATTRLLERFEWDGVAMVEFKEDEETGVPYVMEVNARFWGSLQLAVDAGVDFPRLLVELALGGRPQPVTDYREGIRSRWLWGEVDHVIGCLRMPRARRESLPDLPGPARALARLVIPWRPGDRLEVLRFDDPGPFLRESGQWLRGLKR